MYDAAVKPAAGVMSGVRKDTATRILFLLASEEDKPVVSGIGQEARNLGIRINSYVAKDDWQGELKKLLEIELKNFVETDMTKFAPLMEIRIKDGADTRDTVNKMMDEILIRLGYQDKIKDIRARIRLVQVQVEPGRRTNPAVEFFADVGMLECDRYVNGDYGEDRTPPRDLQEHFITLLKLSIKNGTDFEGRNISDILNMIFSGHLLQIRPVDFRTFDQWNKANRKLMQSA